MSYRKTTVDPRVMQEYLEALARCTDGAHTQEDKRILLRSFAELQFHLRGGQRCPVCNAHVRHVLPVASERHDGSQHTFECLCTRCFEGEKAVSKSISIRMGETIVYFETNGDLTFVEPHPDSLRRTTLMCF